MRHGNGCGSGARLAFLGFGTFPVLGRGAVMFGFLTRKVKGDCLSGGVGRTTVSGTGSEGERAAKRFPVIEVVMLVELSESGVNVSFPWVLTGIQSCKAILL